MTDDQHDGMREQQRFRLRRAVLQRAVFAEGTPSAERAAAERELEALDRDHGAERSVRATSVEGSDGGAAPRSPAADTAVANSAAARSAAARSAAADGAAAAADSTVTESAVANGDIDYAGIRRVDGTRPGRRAGTGHETAIGVETGTGIGGGDRDGDGYGDAGEGGRGDANSGEGGRGVDDVSGRGGGLHNPFARRIGTIIHSPVFRVGVTAGVIAVVAGFVIGSLSATAGYRPLDVALPSPSPTVELAPGGNSYASVFQRGQVVADLPAVPLPSNLDAASFRVLSTGQFTSGAAYATKDFLGNICLVIYARSTDYAATCSSLESVARDGLQLSMITPTRVDPTTGELSGRKIDLHVEWAPDGALTFSSSQRAEL